MNLKKIKMVLVIFLLFNINLIAIYGEDMDYKYEMSELIKAIRNEAPEEYILIQQNAVDLYFEGEHMRRDWLSRIDAMSQESIYYGDPEYNNKTPGEYRSFLTRKLRVVKEEGKPVFVTNYTKGFFRKWFSERDAKKEGFVNYSAPNLEASKINKKIKNENTDDIATLKDVRNYLYLLNPEEFKDKEEYIEVLAGTNYDLIIIDAFFNGKKLTKRDIVRLKKKKNGSERLVISYLSIGEAEDYRYYWKDRWDKEKPQWLREENENWEGNYRVEYWNEEWKEIVLNYLGEIVKSDFDGVFLDTVDTYYYYIYE